MKTKVTPSLPHAGTKHQQWVNDFWSCESDNPKITWSLCHIINVSATFKTNNACDHIASLLNIGVKAVSMIFILAS